MIVYVRSGLPIMNEDAISTMIMKGCTLMIGASVDRERTFDRAPL